MMGSWAAIGASARREWGFLWRSRWDMALSVWVPWLLIGLVMIVFLNGTLRHVPIAVVDHDHSETSRSLIRKLSASPGIHVKAVPASLEEAWSLVRRLDVYAVVHIPSDVSRQMARGGSGTVFAFYNASYMTIGQSAARDIAAALQAQNIETTRMRSQYLKDRPALAAVPVQVQSTVLFNAARSYEHFLVGLVAPAILQLAFCLSVVAAFGRELRDGTVAAWLAACDGRLVAAALGKLLPYLVLFLAHGAATLFWLAHVRGDGIAGSAVVLMLGYAALYLAYAAMAVLLVGLTRNMATALSLTGMYTGVALAFSGGTFPLIGGPLFTQIWSYLLPFTAYVQLQMQQLDMGAPWHVSMWQVSAMLMFLVIAGPIGMALYRRAADDPASWGQR
ncbi:MAG: ABC transporter permease [Lautropia sp.]|nr:ABC transporter permease [Lautropia sp.]